MKRYYRHYFKYDGDVTEWLNAHQEATAISITVVKDRSFAGSEDYCLFYYIES